MTWKIAANSTVLVFCIASILWIAFRKTATEPIIPKAPTLLDSNALAEMRAGRLEFFESDVEPCIATAHSLNREAASRCVTRIGESFDGYRTVPGLDSFGRVFLTLTGQMVNLI